MELTLTYNTKLPLGAQFGQHFNHVLIQQFQWSVDVLWGEDGSVWQIFLRINIELSKASRHLCLQLRDADSI